MFKLQKRRRQYECLRLQKGEDNISEVTKKEKTNMSVSSYKKGEDNISV